jgi:hypothetical protein
MSEIKDKANRRIYKKSFFSRVFTVLVIIIIAIFVLVSLILISLPPVLPDGVLCGNNMSGLGKAIYMYRNDYDGKYPNAYNWCDLLVIYEEVNPEHLICKGSDAKIGESSYALNKNISGKKTSEIPEDTVILFETNYGKGSSDRKGTFGERQCYKTISSFGKNWDSSWFRKYKSSEKVYKFRWNQFGGSELLTTENHDDEGSWILFNDMHVEFVKAERLGELKWDTEKQDSESIE